MHEDEDEDLAELLAEVRRIDVQSRRLVTDVMSGGYQSVFRGAGLEFDEVREYAEGDDPRRVDWSVTARMGRPFVKKYAEESSQISGYFQGLNLTKTRVVDPTTVEVVFDEARSAGRAAASASPPTTRRA